MDNAARICNDATIISFAPYLQRKQEQNKFKVAAPIIDDKYSETKVNLKTPVDPLTKEEYKKIRDYFFNNGDYFKTMPTNRRNYLYVVLSINLMRRCGDMVKLRVCDVLNEDGTFKEHIIFNHEEKTGKRAVVLLNSKCKEALTEYFNFIKVYNMSD